MQRILSPRVTLDATMESTMTGAENKRNIRNLKG